MRGASWLDVLERERTYVVLSSRAYEEIADLRYWLRDAILVRWLRECQRFAGEDRDVRIDVLLLEPPGRDQELVKELKATYWQAELRRCLYSGAVLAREQHLDHVLPFAHFPVNLFWNLVPSTPDMNSKKRDRVPELSEPFVGRYRGFLDRCLELETPLIRRQLDATWRRYFQESDLPDVSRQQLADHLFEHVRQSWARLESAGVEVWTPPLAASG